MADPISAFAAWSTAQIITAIGSSSLLTAQIVYGTAYVVGAAAASAGLNYAVNAVVGGGGAPSTHGQTVAATGEVEPNRHLIGRSRVYGVMAWTGSFAWKSGDTKNSGFGQMQVLSSTPITEIEKVLCSDIEMIPQVEVLTGDGLFFAAALDPYNRGQIVGASRLYYNFDLGSDPGVRDPLLGWHSDQAWQPKIVPPYYDPDSLLPLAPFYDTNARGDGIAKLSSAAFQDVNSFPQGPPRMSVVAKGLACFDPRDPAQDADDPETWEWSENPAILAAWYITRPFGFGATYDDIDLDTLIAAADACDEEVETLESTLAAGDPPLEPRYRCGGEVIESENRDQVLAAIVATMAGSWCNSGGKWFLYAGVYTAPTEAIDDDWIMRNVEFIAQRSRLALYNTVRGTFMSEARRWQAAPFPQVQDAAALAADNGQEIVETIDLPFVPSHTQAQRCMMIEMRRTHKPRVFSFETPVGYALRLIVGQTVSLTQIEAGYGIDDVPFRVASWELAPQDDTGEIWVKIMLDEDGEDIYDVGIDGFGDAAAQTPSDDPPGGADDSTGGTEGAPTGTVTGVYV